MPKHRGTFKLGRAWRCEAARNLAGLPRSQRVVLKELAYRGNERGYCYPSYKQLAKWTGYSSKTIQRAIAALEQKQLIRRRRFVRADGSHAVYGIALTIPLPVLGAGHSVHKTRDTESSHKLNSEIKKKDYADRYRILEDDVLWIFEPLIELKRPPNLISLFEVTNWTLAQRDLKWDEIRSRVLEVAQRLYDELLASSKMLESWEQLVAALSDSRCERQTDEPGSQRQRSIAKDKQVRENLCCLGISDRGDLEFNRILGEFSSHKTNCEIVLETGSPSMAARLVQDYRRLLQEVSRATSRNVTIVCNTSVIFSTNSRV